MQTGPLKSRLTTQRIMGSQPCGRRGAQTCMPRGAAPGRTPTSLQVSTKTCPEAPSPCLADHTAQGSVTSSSRLLNQGATVCARGCVGENGHTGGTLPVGTFQRRTFSRASVGVCIHAHTRQGEATACGANTGQAPPPPGRARDTLPSGAGSHVQALSQPLLTPPPFPSSEPAAGRPSPGPAPPNPSLPEASL